MERNREGREEGSKDPNQVALDKFLEGKLKAEDSKIGFNKVYRVLKALSDNNPLAVASDPKEITSYFNDSCAFMKPAEEE